ncbi:hypothetical protein EXIGLDRAFT_839796 [Exidia glandulosa HHB12029]|uniref:F-box domain-containing protein n=1 Tax=Exidia glandulosa HHB12029 TaxID=1314781 RepID=A0A166A1F5_EXIGL|nr:hypothetical protein EXIGLDRAFT_839796 [Exidia glandulosa HHB12029]
MVVLRRFLCWRTESICDPPNQGCPAARLPAEVLCAMFLLLDFGDRLSTSHVCAHWRAASLSHPRLLWSTIHTKGRRRGAFRLQLERAKDFPVAVEIDITLTPQYKRAIRELPRIMAALADHMFHVTSLVVHLFGYASQHLNPALNALRAQPAPLLRTLHLDLDRWSVPMQRRRQRARLYDDVFARHAPCLTDVRLGGISLPLQQRVSAFNDVTKLHVSLSQTDILWEVLFALPLMSGLRYLRLSGSSWGSPPMHVWSIKLRRLHLDLEQPLPWLCSYLGGADVETLWAAYLFTGPELDGVFPLDDPHLHTRAYLHDDNSTRDIEIIRSDGKYRCLHAVAREVEIPALILEYLSDVTIDERYLISCTSPSTISLPHVVRLAIVLMESPTHGEEDIECACETLLHCVAHHSCSTLYTPLLEEVDIHAVSTSYVSKPLTVGPEEVLALLGHIEHGDTTLTRLSISGVELVTHVRAPLSQLLEVAESIIVDKEYIGTVRLEGAPAESIE